MNAANQRVSRRSDLIPSSKVGRVHHEGTHLQNDPCPVDVVLVVDDQDDLRETLAEICMEEGYAVETAAHGQEAIDRLEHGCKPCVIVLDLMMPVMNGFDFLRWLKDNEKRIGHIPVLVVSANAKEHERTLTAYRPDGILEKPMRLEKLLRSIHAHCTSSGRTC
jgi:two-component system, chemotaxis family, chemotaxis protein CheY